MADVSKAVSGQSPGDDPVIEGIYLMARINYFCGLKAPDVRICCHCQHTLAKIRSALWYNMEGIFNSQNLSSHDSGVRR
jgi:hypothetical protein